MILSVEASFDLLVVVPQFSGNEKDLVAAIESIEGELIFSDFDQAGKVDTRIEAVLSGDSSHQVIIGDVTMVKRNVCGKRGSMPSTACLRSPTASIRCVASTSPT